MDCYSEYKQHVHPAHQSYSSTAAAGNHPYYPGSYGTSSMRYAHAHTLGESGQQQNWIDGYSRYGQNQHHISSHGSFGNSFNNHQYGTIRENFHANNETREQFYYQNNHHASPSYYGNHAYDSYRNASSNYHYHYGSGSGSGGNYHQSASHPTQYYQPSYNASPEQFHNRYYPTPPPNQRESYPLSHPPPVDRATNYTPAIESKSNERMTSEVVKASSNDQVASPINDEKSTDNEKSNEQKMKLEESSERLGENDKSKLESCESVKVEKIENDNNFRTFENVQQESIFNDQNHQNQRQLPVDEDSTKTTEAAQDSSTKASDNSIPTEEQSAKDLQNNRLRKLKEKEKCTKDSNRKSFDLSSSANDPFSRCSTPFASMTSLPFNHHHVSPSSYPPHQRLPPNFPHAAAHNYWYSQQHPPHHNWMMNPYIRNRRGSYTDAQTLPSSIPFPRNAVNEKFKMYEESSPPPKRTKRKPKPEVSMKQDPKNEIMKNVTPLPGFLQTFGGTEIGRFSEAFFTSSDSPNPYYNNSIESDVESPQPWDFDSLDGPVNMQVGAAFQVFGSETEYDSPINNFSELICNEY